MFSQALARGLNVEHGYFPNALPAAQRFDVIVFNDVIEHIPEIRRALSEAHSRLNPHGILILNLPNRNGFFYRLSKLLKRSGISGPFGRLWQKDLPSPHVHYFNAQNLELLVKSQNFSVVEKFESPSVRSDGLLQRIRCVGGQSKIKSYIQYVIIRGIIPFLRLFPSDIIVVIFKKN